MGRVDPNRGYHLPGAFETPATVSITVPSASQKTREFSRETTDTPPVVCQTGTRPRLGSVSSVRPDTVIGPSSLFPDPTPEPSPVSVFHVSHLESLTAVTSSSPSPRRTVERPESLARLLWRVTYPNYPPPFVKLPPPVLLLES